MANTCDGHVIHLDTFAADIDINDLLNRSTRGGPLRLMSISWGKMTAAHVAAVRVDTPTGTQVFAQTAKANNDFFHAYFGGVQVNNLALDAAENTGGIIIITLG